MSTEPSEGGGPRIAVVIPCYNDGATIRETVDSLEEAEQPQLVVVDDGSTDPATIEVLAALEREGIDVRRHERNMGLPAARNTGLAATSAPFVYPLDSDDLAVPGSLGRMADRLGRDPDAVACYGDWIEFGPHRKVRRVPRHFDPYLVAYRNRYPVASLFRRTFLEEVGGWQSVGGMVGYEDWDLWLTAAERGERVVFVDGVLTLQYRVHGGRMFRAAAKNHRALYAELRARHPKLYAELPRHRRRSKLPRLERLTLPLLFGSRPPLGIRSRAEVMSGRLGRAVAGLRRRRPRSRRGAARPRSPRSRRR
jgi:glycosyltransferase involved in cell wall biosynthesis